MKQYKCKCNGYIRPPFVVGATKHNYKNLYMCIDCGKTYIKIDNTLKPLSKTQTQLILKKGTGIIKCLNKNGLK